MNQERVQAELKNLEEKMTRAETSEDLWYIIIRLAKALPNDADLGKYIRKICKNKQ